MVTKVQTSNITDVLEGQMTLFITAAAGAIGADNTDVLTALWQDRKGDFVKGITTIFKKRKRSGKHGKSAYIFFCGPERVKIKDEKPELKGQGRHERAWRAVERSQEGVTSASGSRWRLTTRNG